MKKQNEDYDECVWIEYFYDDLLEKKVYIKEYSDILTALTCLYFEKGIEEHKSKLLCVRKSLIDTLKNTTRTQVDYISEINLFLNS